jgi:hypothetical protein
VGTLRSELGQTLAPGAAPFGFNGAAVDFVFLFVFYPRKPFTALITVQPSFSTIHFFLFHAHSFAFFCILLHFFAGNGNATLSFSIASALCVKKRGAELFLLFLCELCAFCDLCVNSDSCFELSSVNFQPLLEALPLASPRRSARIRVETL